MKYLITLLLGISSCFCSEELNTSNKSPIPETLYLSEKPIPSTQFTPYHFAYGLVGSSLTVFVPNGQVGFGYRAVYAPRLGVDAALYINMPVLVDSISGKVLSLFYFKDALQNQPKGYFGLGIGVSYVLKGFSDFPISVDRGFYIAPKFALGRQWEISKKHQAFFQGEISWPIWQLRYNEMMYEDTPLPIISLQFGYGF